MITDDNGLPQNRGRRGGGTLRPDDPSPAEIERLCEIIRQSWPEWRLNQGRQEWVVQQHYSQLADALMGSHIRGIPLQDAPRRTRGSSWDRWGGH